MRSWEAWRRRGIISPSIEGWAPILLEDDTTGWVARKYLQEAQEAPEAEVREKPAPKDSEGRVSHLSK